MRWSALVLLGCTSGPEVNTITKTVTITETVTVDTDTGSNTDTGSVAPCPLAGEWTITEANCGPSSPIGLVGTPTATVTGTAELCLLQLDVTTAATGEPSYYDECTFTENVELAAITDGLWSGSTDAAGEPPCRSSGTGPRDLGVIEVTGLPSGEVELFVRYEAAGQYLQLTFCTSEQWVTLAPAL